MQTAAYRSTIGALSEFEDLKEELTMSVDRYEREYHLTPRGWVKGTFTHYGTVKEEIPAPSDRVFTRIEEVEDSFGFNSSEVSWRDGWRSRKVTRQQIDLLFRKFGEYPKRA